MATMFDEAEIELNEGRNHQLVAATATGSMSTGTGNRMDKEHE